MDKMLTKRQRRITRQVRIGLDIHKEIRKLAIDRGITTSKLVDEILLENSELNNLLTFKETLLKDHTKKAMKTLRKEGEKTATDFNKISF